MTSPDIDIYVFIFGFKPNISMFHIWRKNIWKNIVSFFEIYHCYFQNKNIALAGWGELIILGLQRPRS